MLHFFLDLEGFFYFNNNNKMHERNIKRGIGMEFVDPIYDVKDIQRMRKAILRYNTRRPSLIFLI